MTYNYLEAVTEDALEFIRDNYDVEDLRENLNRRDEFEQELNDEMWCADSVTGNGSGSYFFNSNRAAEALMHNLVI